MRGWLSSLSKLSSRFSEVEFRRRAVGRFIDAEIDIFERAEGRHTPRRAFGGKGVRGQTDRHRERAESGGSAQDGEGEGQQGSRRHIAGGEEGFAGPPGRRVPILGFNDSGDEIFVTGRGSLPFCR